jgi:PAS domain S-box-containing protein
LANKPNQNADQARWMRAAVATAADGIVVVDAAERIRLYNPASQRLFGYSADEVIGQTLGMLLAKPDANGLIRDSENTSCAGIGRRKDGATFPLELSIGTSGHAIERVHVVIIQDISEGHRRGQEVRDSERNYRRLVDGVTDYAIYMLDLEGRVTSWNAGAQRIKQFTAAEVLGHHFREFYTEEERLSSAPEHNLEIARLAGRYEAKAWRLRKDGTQFWAHVVIEPLKNDQGELIGFAKVTSDITERRRVDQVIREADERINTLIETVVDGVMLVDARGRIRTFNLACQRLFGYRAEEVIGQHVRVLMPTIIGEGSDSIFAGHQYFGEHAQVGRTREIRGQRKDGTSFPLDLSVGAAKQDGDTVFVGVVHDLTERKRTEEQLVQAQKMETVGQLSGGIAHDFNNLLTVIVGNAEFLSDQLKARQDLRNLADDIGRAGGRGAELTQRLLAFSRRQSLMPVEVDCNQLLDSMHKLLRRTLREDIEVTTDFDQGLRTAFADRAQLESAIINLALNAQDAMEGGGRLSITTANVSLDGSYRGVHPEVEPGEYVLIAVTDNGEGMPKDVLDHVFEPFFTTKEVGKGSGLGLSMVYGFVKQSNGHVSLYSEPGLGTTVRLYLPALPGASLKLDEEDAVPQVSLSGSEVVLIVEDDPFVRSYAVMSLRSLGYAVIASVDGTDALQKLNSDIPIDILFTDIVMPGGINGWELADLAIAERPDLRILLTSGYALDTMAARGRLPDRSVILTKPYRKAELARRLREMMMEPRTLQ